MLFTMDIRDTLSFCIKDMLANTSSKLTKKCMYEVIQKVGSSIRSCGYGQGVKCGIFGANCPGWIISMEITSIFRDEHNADPVAAVEFPAKYCKRAMVTLGHNGCIAKHGKEVLDSAVNCLLLCIDHLENMTNYTIMVVWFKLQEFVLKPLPPNIVHIRI
ncbi:Long chain acyl-CoA synthetase [Arachis hypogaea]|nr:Long chain acyl-CoA synthetase [Arachis hypogaea]